MTQFCQQSDIKAKGILQTESTKHLARDLTSVLQSLPSPDDTDLPLEGQFSVVT